jgi:hypothetical protein
MSAEKLALLRLINGIVVTTCAELIQLHSALCFIRAFPDTPAHSRAAHSLLARFEDRVRTLSSTERAGLSDTGISGTPVHYSFSYPVAVWMARRLKGAVEIDWSEDDETKRLDELLELIMLPAETEYFDSGRVSGQEWLELVSGGRDMTTFDWLIAQLQRLRRMPSLAQMYDACELSLVWDLNDPAFSKSRNRLRIPAVVGRHGMRKRVSSAKAEIMRPVENLRILPVREGAKLVDVAMASLAVRHRETYHFNFANPREIYLADVGEGISIAVLGLLQEYRFPLECTMGFLMLSNGVPIGYGGASAVFRQVNTGINLFDEYRRSEAAFLWIQVMRVFRHVLGCNRFIANPYQLGSDNTEALQSGAFWFYYRLGYRPVSNAIRKLALQESKRMQEDKAYRSNLRTLRRLSSCDMHLVLPGGRASDLFEERWIEESSLLATRELAANGATTRAEAEESIAARVARDTGLRSVARWSATEKRAFRQLAPFVAAARPAEWPAEAKRSMRRLLRKKGGANEAEYARLLSGHEHFLSAIRARCRASEG